MKLNKIRKSMKLFLSELGNIFSKMFTIIWAFTANPKQALENRFYNPNVLKQGNN